MDIRHMNLHKKWSSVILTESHHPLARPLMPISMPIFLQTKLKCFTMNLPGNYSVTLTCNVLLTYIRMNFRSRNC